MSSLKKLKRDHAEANLSSVEAMINRLSDEDAVTRISLEQHRDELREEIAAAAQEHPEQTASASLFFSGQPVVGGVGIDSAFGGKALEVFQDLVAKEFAIETGGLAQRGVVRHRDAARLHITNIVRGSFGFRLDELTEVAPLMETALKTAVSRALVLMDAFAHEDDQRFQEVVEATDQRVFNAAKEFFKLMHDEQARFKALSENFDKTFDALDIDRAFNRGELTRVVDAEEQLRGALMGVLPDGHQFEFRREEPPGVIRGKVDRDLPADVLASYNRDYLDRQSIAAVRVRRVLKGEEVVRESFLLLRLQPVEQNLLP